MIILGIDPGLATMGYGVIKYDGYLMTLVDFGAIITPAGMYLSERLDIIYESVSVLIDRFLPRAVAFEELFFSKNVKTAISVAQARGAAIAAAYKKTRDIFEYTPLQVKQAVTGYGRADKAQIQAMVKTILSLKAPPKPDDAADALAVAICHGQSHKAAKAFRL